MKNKKKKKKKIIVISLILAIIAIATAIILVILNNQNELTLSEKNWVNDNSGVVQNVNIINNSNNFAINGEGVFFDFLTDFGEENNLDINPITYEKEEDAKGLAFKVSSEEDEDGVLFYKDNYAVVGKDSQSLKTIESVSNQKVGILTTDATLIKEYLNDIEVELVEYETTDEIIAAVKDGSVKYYITSVNESMIDILKNDFKINYHISDLNTYYYLQTEKDNILSDIMIKYSSDWLKEDFLETYNESVLNTFITTLEITEQEQVTLTDKIYEYGFVENNPYEILIAGNYGGITSIYLKRYSEFSDVEYTFTKYKTSGDLNNAILKEEIDLYYNTKEMVSEYITVPSLQHIEYSIVANKGNYLVIDNVETIKDKTIYVLKDSIIEKHLNDNKFKTESFEDYKELFKAVDKDNSNLMAIDSNTFKFYVADELKDYSERYSETLDKTYTFKIKNDDNKTNQELFTKYVNFLDPKKITNTGIYNHEQTLRNGTIISNLAQYSIYLILLGILALYIFYRLTRKIKVAKKIKKEDKIKFIDQLTSLKNRNYLNENITSWNNNNIYPQATIIMDLNSIQELNDTLGYDQGDAQIKAAANILIKTQLDNTDIIRTDGNEFLIYLVGYKEKQIISYIRKLQKELKSLPFDYGAAVGYSMIIDDIKTVEDSINEAIEDMRLKKEEGYEE